MDPGATVPSDPIGSGEKTYFATVPAAVASVMLGTTNNELARITPPRAARVRDIRIFTVDATFPLPPRPSSARP
jgi:hypothetical protein